MNRKILGLLPDRILKQEIDILAQGLATTLPRDLSIEGSKRTTSCKAVHLPDVLANFVDIKIRVFDIIRIFIFAVLNEKLKQMSSKQHERKSKNRIDKNISV